MANKAKLNGAVVIQEIEGLGTQAFLAAIVDSSDDAIYGKTLDGIITQLIDLWLREGS